MASDIDMIKSTIETLGGSYDDIAADDEEALRKRLIEVCAGLKGGGGSTGGGLPTGSEPHQMLVTDKAGKAGWEDKLCWAESETVTVLPETVMESTNEGFIGQRPMEKEIVLGNIYTVTYNGVNYQCEALAGDGYTFGNLGAIAEGYPTSDDPFVLIVVPPEVAEQWGGHSLLIPLDGADSVTVSVHETTEKIKPIDPENLAPGVAANRMLVTNAEGKAEWQERTHYAESALMEFIPETEFELNYNEYINGATSTPFEITENVPASGSTCFVTWNGESYECTAFTVQGMPGTDAICIGNGKLFNQADTGEPFAINISTNSVTGVSQVMVAALSNIASAVVAVSIISETVHKLDPKYMPDGIGDLNLVNGSAQGSLRQSSAAPEDDSYTMGISAIALGNNTKASQMFAVALGQVTQATAVGAVALGASTRASGTNAVAMGEGTIANTTNAVAMGEGTKAQAINQLVIGKYNIDDMYRQYPFIIGGGTAENDRKDIFIVDWDGTVWARGGIECAHHILTSPNGTRYKLTVSDDGTLTAVAL